MHRAHRRVDCDLIHRARATAFDAGGAIQRSVALQVPAQRDDGDRRSATAAGKAPAVAKLSSYQPQQQVLLTHREHAVLAVARAGGRTLVCRIGIRRVGVRRRTALIGRLVEQRGDAIGIELLLLPGLLGLLAGVCELFLLLLGLFLFFCLLFFFGLLFLGGLPGFLGLLVLLGSLLRRFLSGFGFLELFTSSGVGPGGVAASFSAIGSGFSGSACFSGAGFGGSGSGGFGGSGFGGSSAGGGGAAGGGSGAVIGFGFGASFLEISSDGFSSALAVISLLSGSPCRSRVNSDGVMMATSIGGVSGTSRRGAVATAHIAHARSATCRTTEMASPKCMALPGQPPLSSSLTNDTLVKPPSTMRPMTFNTAP